MKLIMQSLRGRLTVWLVGGAGLLLVLGALVLSWVTDRQLEKEFDDALLTQARSLVAMTELEEGRIWLEGSEAMLEFAAGPDPQYYQLWSGDGRVIERSRSLGSRTLPRRRMRLDQPQFFDGRLHDSRSGRFVEISFTPRIEEEEVDALTTGPPPARPSVQPVTLVVASSREHLDAFLSSLHATLAGFVLALLVGMAVLIHLSLAAGLAPVEGLAAKLRGLDAESLGERIEEAGTPSELAPVVEHLNGLLERLKASFARERTFSSNFAHELRTPLAELRSLTEIALGSPDDATAMAEVLEDIHAVGLQMESIVINLLDLARCEGGLHVVRPSELALADAIKDCWQKVEDTAAARGVSLVPEISPSLVVTTDREKLDRILINLFSNAVAYSPAGSEIRCAACAVGDGFFLSVSNPTDALEPDDLPRIFDRFWRKDAARADAGHAGLGLSLVAAFCALVGIQVEARLNPGRIFEIRLQAARV